MSPPRTSGIRESPTIEADGYAPPFYWGDSELVERVQHEALNTWRPTHDSVLRNPHLGVPWVQDAVTAAPLVEQVRDRLGAAVSIENTFVLFKRDGDNFDVPLHQDGVNPNLELDPDSSISAWLAVTDAGIDAGCLEVSPGSHAAGYGSTELDEQAGSVGGRVSYRTAGSVPSGRQLVPLPMKAGEACVFDVRLLHRSGSNSAQPVRIGINVRYVASGTAIPLRRATHPLVPVV